MRQTVILLHQHPTNADHFDWLIDQPAVPSEHRLITFRTTHRPDEPATFQAHHAPDHRAHYLTYQGPLSQSRGSVTRISQGQVVRWDQQQTRISAQIQWENHSLHYLATREPDGEIWTFIASNAPTP